LNDIDEKYYECLSTSCNKLLKLSFNIIRSTKKCIAYLKIYKSYISTNVAANTTNANSAATELNSMDYDLELINLIANHETTYESDNENQNTSKKKNNNKNDLTDNDNIDDDNNDDDDEDDISFKEECVDDDEDEDYEYEEEETINKKRKLVAKSIMEFKNAKKSKPAKKIVKVVIGGTRNKSATSSTKRRVNHQSDEESENEIESHSSRRGRSMPLSSNDTNVAVNARRRTVGAASTAAPTPVAVKHTASPSPKKNYYHCEQCSFKTVSRDHLKLHTQTHKRKKSKSAAAAASSSVSIGKGKIIKCKHCNFFASDPARIWEHQKMEHNDESEVILADLNALTTAPAAASSTSGNTGATDSSSISENKEALSVSLNQTIDLKEKQKQCDKCPYKTSDAPHLKRHMNNHTFVENFFKCRYFALSLLTKFSFSTE
jgi:hypothetical protein